MNTITGRILYDEQKSLMGQIRNIEKDFYSNENIKKSRLKELNGFLNDLNEDIEKLKELK